MSVVINTNVQSLLAQNSLNKNTNALNKSLEQLSTGLKVNRAADDAAGMSIADLMTSQIRGNSKAMDNVQDGINLINTAEGGMVAATSNLQRIRELLVQAANEIYSVDSKQAILNEVEERLKEIDRTADAAKFNGLDLLNGKTTTLSLQIGANSDAAVNSIDIGPSLTNIHISAGGLDIVLPAGTTGATWTATDMRTYMDRIDAAINQITKDRSMMGSYAGRLESAYDNLVTMNESLEGSRSRIIDVDVAQASSQMIKYQILQQTSASVLAQANQLPSIALKLIG